MDDAALADLAQGVKVFAKVSPEQKARVIRALHAKGHVVGFLGDGVNDSPALRAADVGISVDTAVDIARESADIILLDKSLLVLRQGVVEGRKVFGNIVKYIKMGASSNFGTMFSVLARACSCPFCRCCRRRCSRTICSMISRRPRYRPTMWTRTISPFRANGHRQSVQVHAGDGAGQLDLRLCDLLCSDPLLRRLEQSVAVPDRMVHRVAAVADAQIIHIIRTAKIPFLQSRPSAALVAMSLVICAIGVALPFTAAERR